MNRTFTELLAVALLAALSTAAFADEKPAAGLIPKAAQAVKMDGTLDSWAGAFVAPVHVGHPDFRNRGGEFLYLWDVDNLYIGLRCLDEHPAHVGSAIWDGDAVEFYLDTRAGELGGQQFAPGTLHMFWTPFTGSEIKPRWAVRDLPAFKNFKLHGVEIAGQKTSWGWTAEFKLPWANFPDFKPAAGRAIGIDCELCSSDGENRVDRTFVYSSPADVNTPAAFGRVKLVDKIEPADLKPLGRVLLPMSLTHSGNYEYLYATACISPTIETNVARLEGRIVDASGKARMATPGNRKTLEGSGFTLWTASWELFELPPGAYRVELTAFDKSGKVITSRSEGFLHGSSCWRKGWRSAMTRNFDNCPRIVVVGSVNVDMVVKSARLPAAGETMTGGRFLMAPGGKGANQAVAAARLGAAVTLVARVGRDIFGDQAIAGFEREGHKYRGDFARFGTADRRGADFGR